MNVGETFGGVWEGGWQDTGREVDCGGWSQERVGIESNQDNLYTYMTLLKNKFNKRYFRKEKKSQTKTQNKTLEQQ